MKRAAKWSVVALGVTIAACSSPSSPTEDKGALAQAFRADADATSVPRDLLVAIAAVEGGLKLPGHRTVNPDSDAPAAGPLELRHGKFDSLARAASIANVSEITLRQETDLALFAGARVLAELGAKTGATSDLASWQSAVETMSGYADQAHREEYAHRVFALLAIGGSFAARAGETITIAPHDIPPGLTVDLSGSVKIESTGAPEYPAAEWIQTSCDNKCNTDRSGSSISMIVIHDTEGDWDASVATLQNDPEKSVHYIVGTDGRVAQFVPESYTAWHSGNSYYNARSVGIEHVGVSTEAYPAAEYTASAALVNYLTAKYDVAPDRAHIIGHDQVPNGSAMGESAPPCGDAPKTCETGSDYGGANNHRDPGVWEWATYMPKIAGSAKCDDMTDVYNCSSDRTEAFACKSGMVVVKTCKTACVTEGTGVDDQCDEATASTKPHPGPSSSGDPSASGDPGSEASAAPPPAGSSSGCAMSPRPEKGSFYAFFAIGALVLANRFRRRVRV